MAEAASFGTIIEVPELNRKNYKIWKEMVLLHLGVTDINYAIRKDEPPAITETSLPYAVDIYEKWERSNRLCINFVKSKLSSIMRGSVEKIEKVRPLLQAIDEQFQISDEELAGTLIEKFYSLRLTGLGGVREYIMQMSDIADKLKILEIEMSESFVVHYILDNLPHQFGPFKIFYNTDKVKWSMIELLTMCTQEEGRLMMEEEESVMLATKKKDDKHSKAKQKGKDLKPKGGFFKKFKCFFCKEKGHIRNECPNFYQWRKNKGYGQREDQLEINEAFQQLSLLEPSK